MDKATHSDRTELAQQRELIESRYAALQKEYEDKLVNKYNNNEKSFQRSEPKLFQKLNSLHSAMFTLDNNEITANQEGERLVKDLDKARENKATDNIMISDGSVFYWDEDNQDFIKGDPKQKELYTDENGEQHLRKPLSIGQYYEKAINNVSAFKGGTYVARENYQAYDSGAFMNYIDSGLKEIENNFYEQNGGGTTRGSKRYNELLLESGRTIISKGGDDNNPALTKRAYILLDNMPDDVKADLYNQYQKANTTESFADYTENKLLAIASSRYNIEAPEEIIKDPANDETSRLRRIARSYTDSDSDLWHNGATTFGHMQLNIPAGVINRVVSQVESTKEAYLKNNPGDEDKASIYAVQEVLNRPGNEDIKKEYTKSAEIMFNALNFPADAAETLIGDGYSAKYNVMYRDIDVDDYLNSTMKEKRPEFIIGPMGEKVMGYKEGAPVMVEVGKQFKGAITGEKGAKQTSYAYTGEFVVTEEWLKKTMVKNRLNMTVSYMDYLEDMGVELKEVELSDFLVEIDKGHAAYKGSFDLFKNAAQLSQNYDGQLYQIGLTIPGYIKFKESAYQEVNPTGTSNVKYNQGR